jgi:predicted amidohydrolase
MKLLLTRRRLMACAGAASLASVSTMASAMSPLTSPEITAGSGAKRMSLALVQRDFLAISARSLARDVQHNIEQMTATIACAQMRQRHDWMAFNDCPVTGRASLDRSEVAQVAMTKSDPRLQPLFESARRHRCWISFGQPMRPDPRTDEIIDGTVCISPRGEIEGFLWSTAEKSLRPGAITPPLITPTLITEFGVISTYSSMSALHRRRPLSLDADLVLYPSAPVSAWAQPSSPAPASRTRGYHAIIAAACSDARPPGASMAWAPASRIVDPDGRTLAAADPHTDCVLSAELDLAQPRA